MNTTFYCMPKNSDLMHYGVKGMKWGVRKDTARNSPNKKHIKKAVIIGVSVVGAALIAYGGYKIATNPVIRQKGIRMVKRMFGKTGAKPVKTNSLPTYAHISKSKSNINRRYVNTHGEGRLTRHGKIQNRWSANMDTASYFYRKARLLPKGDKKADILRRYGNMYADEAERIRLAGGDTNYYPRHIGRPGRGAKTIKRLN